MQEVQESESMKESSLRTIKDTIREQLMKFVVYLVDPTPPGLVIANCLPFSWTLAAHLELKKKLDNHLYLGFYSAESAIKHNL